MSRFAEGDEVRSTGALLRVGDDAKQCLKTLSCLSDYPRMKVEHCVSAVSRRPIELVLEAGFVDCFRERHPSGRGWTYLAWHPWARFDYLFARETAHACEVVETQASDHFALVADF